VKPKPKAEPINDVSCLRPLPEKADENEEPIRKYRWKTTPKEREMPKVAEGKEGGFALFCGWLEDKSDNGNSGQSKLPALRGKKKKKNKKS
jgi:hypothetical protein